jgi:hypothetical protein
MKAMNKPNRRYPRRRLRGFVDVSYSARVKFPKFHLVADCEGFVSTPDEARLSRRFDTAVELGVCAEGRPCRMCTLESVLVSVLDPRPATERNILVTFTSQANPRSPDASVFHFDWLSATTSGASRLHRLARRGGLAVSATCSGPAAFGYVSTDAAAVLKSNLRSFVIGSGQPAPQPSTVEVFWTLLGDNPPELAAAMGEIEGMDPWEVATLLTME